ncbi:hypothetical protein IV102_01050 [bacterium]|nr:hypothetical protein [bacterium]
MRYWRDLACLIVVLAAASWMLRPPDNPVSVGERQYRANESFQRRLEQELRTRAQDNVDRVMGPGSSITVNVDSSWWDREDKVIVAGEERVARRSGPEIHRISVAVVLRRKSSPQREANIGKLLSTALGLDKGRGDEIFVTTVQ